MFRVTHIILVAAVIFPISPAALGQVFKWVDSEGRTQFSDRPQQNAQAIDLKNIAADSTDQSAGVDGVPGQSLLGPYTAFEIVSPEQNQTLRVAQQNLPVSLIIDPPLMPGHQLKLVMDSVPIAVDQAAVTQMNLTEVPWGSHQVFAEIQDSKGGPIARTTPVTFHLRKPIPPGVLP
jgi:hypothetical protein